MSITTEYNGWNIRTFKQPLILPHRQFCSLVTREVNGVLNGFNKEGRTLDEAISRAKAGCNKRQ